MGWESSGVVGFDLGPLLLGQTRIAKVKSAYNSLIIIIFFIIITDIYIYKSVTTLSDIQ